MNSVQIRKFGIAALIALGVSGIILNSPMVNIDKVRLLSLCFAGGAMILYSMRGKKRMFAFSQTAHKPRGQHERTGKRLDSVIIPNDTRACMDELAQYLKTPERYAKFGARMPRGVLLYGPPGTGKTLIAQALAGEACVPFFACNGSDFVQMYAGVGAGRIRDLFKKAREAGRCVIFIDEIDAIGRTRDSMSSDERDQTLNALLSEMSGFDSCENAGVLVLAATNRLDSLDAALVRPGRFDRQVEVGLPDRKMRAAILKLHSQGKPVAEDICFSTLAGKTASFSGAALENLMNEAAIIAARGQSAGITQCDIDRAYIKILTGGERDHGFLSEDERAYVALHEAGHALMTQIVQPGTLSRVTILPTLNGAAGYSLSTPEDAALLTRDALSARIKILLAGRAAECLIEEAGHITTGAAQDIKKAAEIALSMALDMGMICHPAISLRTIESGATARQAQGAAQAFIEGQFDAATDMLKSRVHTLIEIAEALLDKETLSGEDVRIIINNGEQMTS